MRKLTVFMALFFAFAVLVGTGTGQKTIGIVADSGGQAIVFDADTDTFLGAVKIPTPPPYYMVWDCLIAPDGKLAFVTDFDHRVWVIDLTLTPPALASGINPIPVSTHAIEMEITPDGKYLLVADGYSIPGVPLSVVDIATRMEVDTFPLGTNLSPNAVAVGRDGSVLVVAGEWATWKTTIRRLRIDGSGKLTDTGQYLPSVQAPSVGEVLCATDQDDPSPGKPMGVFLSKGINPLLASLRLDGMTIESTASPSGLFAVDGLVRRQGNQLFVRSNMNPNPSPPGEGLGFIDVFKLHIDECRIGERLLTIPLNRTTGTIEGIEQMAIHPKGKKLYVSGLGLPEIRIYDAKRGDLIDTISIPSTGRFGPMGISVVGP